MSKRKKGQIRVKKAKIRAYVGMIKSSASQRKQIPSSFAGAFDPATNTRIKNANQTA